jgi:hypothetical protein
MNYEDWPNCIVTGCPNKCCLRLRSDKCYPHTMLGDSVSPDFFVSLLKDDTSELCDSTSTEAPGQMNKPTP